MARSAAASYAKRRMRPGSKSVAPTRCLAVVRIPPTRLTHQLPRHPAPAVDPDPDRHVDRGASRRGISQLNVERRARPAGGDAGVRAYCDDVRPRAGTLLPPERVAVVRSDRAQALRDPTDEVGEHVSDVRGGRPNGSHWPRSSSVGRGTRSVASLMRRNATLTSRRLRLVLDRLRNPVIMGRGLGLCERVVDLGHRLEDACPLEALHVELGTARRTDH